MNCWLRTPRRAIRKSAKRYRAICACARAMSTSSERSSEQPSVPAEKWVGTAVLRKEDERLVAGRGTFIDDLELAGLLEAAMLRSPHAHARIVSLEVSEARALPGVFAVITGADVEEVTNPIRPLIPTRTLVRDFCLATDRVRFAGEPVAAVAVGDWATAWDARDVICV